MTLRVAGCDLGKASAGFVIVKVNQDGALEVENAAYTSHEGNPFGVFKKWYQDNHDEPCQRGCPGLQRTGPPSGRRRFRGECR